MAFELPPAGWSARGEQPLAAAAAASGDGGGGSGGGGGGSTLAAAADAEEGGGEEGGGAAPSGDVGSAAPLLVMGVELDRPVRLHARPALPRRVIWRAPGGSCPTALCTRLARRSSSPPPSSPPSRCASLPPPLPSSPPSLASLPLHRGPGASRRSCSRTRDGSTRRTQCCSTPPTRGCAARRPRR